MMRYLVPFGLVVAAFACAAHAETLEAQLTRKGYETVSHWHGGPFFEYRRAIGPNPVGGSREDRLRTFWAFRPFYAQVRAPETTERDFLWPIATCHSREDALWWRAFFIAYGDDREGREPSWSFNLLPIFFCGSDRLDRGYWGLFPLYGTHPHFLLMDDWRFVLWPLWMDYDVKNVHHGAVLWPIVTWKENDTATVGVWPIFSHARLRESDHWYALWPLATWARYDEDRDTSGAGYSWMFWPLCGHVSRARETQYLFLPPFFSYTQTPHVRRWRLPWPLVDVELGSRRNRISVWPFYEHLDGFPYTSADTPPDARTPDERTRRYLWLFAEDTELTTDTTHETRFSIFPFWTYERRQAKGKDGVWRETSSFLRIWPFWRSETEHGRTRRRVLDLVPIRHAEGLDRNWSPFWTFWTSESLRGGSTDHSLLWNIITWTSTGD